MHIHKTGYRTLVISFIALLLINLVIYMIMPLSLWWLSVIINILSLALYIFLVSFFRIPNRSLTFEANKIIAPADGKVVVIEETVDNEYFKEIRLQISIFMSPLNVHRNLYPITGKVVYNKYHKGKYLVAWDPKSSTDNERHSVVLKTETGIEILVKQIAGAVARRICNNAVLGKEVAQNQEMGFIKFGSRVDILLPPGTQVNVDLNASVRSGVTVIATL